MKPTREYVIERYRLFNREIFAGTLPEISVRITRARTYLGQLRYMKRRRRDGGEELTDFELSVSNLLDRPETVVEDTIIHEMIHLYIYWHGLRDTGPHGPVFRQMMAAVNQRHGRHVTVTHRSSDEEKDSDTRRRIHFVCRLRLADGRTGVLVSARTTLADLWRRIEQSPGIAEYSWHVTDNPHFNRYSRVRTLKYYLMADADIDRHLAGARRIQRDGARFRLL